MYSFFTSVTNRHFSKRENSISINQKKRNKMLLNQLRFVRGHLHFKGWRCFSLEQVRYQISPQPQLNECPKVESTTPLKNEAEGRTDKEVLNEIFPAPKVVPMVLTTNKEPVVLSFDDVPGPKTLKYLSSIRQYLSDIGTQITASMLTVGLDIGTFINSRKSFKTLSVLFDEYGPVVRFVSPVGGDIVLVNHPAHIEKVYNMEGDYPVRSTLDSLDKYRTEHRNQFYGGLYTLQGEEWSRQRERIYEPMHKAVDLHLHGLNDVCDNFIKKVYTIRNHQDEVAKDLYTELHKWAFDCLGLIVFSKKFTMLETELVYSQCDMSWLYHCLQKATEAIIKCESGLQMWKIFTTPAWHSLVKYCDSLDSLIGKHVMEAEQTSILRGNPNEKNKNSLINSMLTGEQKMSAEDIATVIMDILLIGVNTITSSTSFLMYHLAKYQMAQKTLYDEVRTLHIDLSDVSYIKAKTPYLQACIKENLRLVPPIPILTRILPRNIILDRYNIPRGTLIIMSTQDAALKESNYDDATKFKPERWLKGDSKYYHAFASIPFGYGARKCLGQNIAETMMTLLTVKTMQKFKLEYHYGDIHPTRTFIAKPNKPLKVRFIDRM
ncbi:unnamed protein product [Chilo suppressalis]|uniref:CYP339A1 n=1 Tax=Chilo suppressalis TaxID=168631 RepID=A0ABN8L2L9_CHISP|nr:unnamed protein product [Chilo suppressalis]